LRSLKKSLKTLIKRKEEYPMRKRAFTIYEMAIVLVIIGIIMGMLVKGSSMIRTAELRKELWKVEKIRAALSVFERQTGQCPGNVCADTAANTKYQDAITDLVDSGLISDSDFVSNFDISSTRWALFPCIAGTGADTSYREGADASLLCVAMYKGGITTPPTASTRTNATPFSVLGGYELYFDDNHTDTGIGRLKKPNGNSGTYSRESFRDFLSRTDNLSSEYDIKVWP
jgi:prepilin-type N-terminal cleavage/methylation domain-containing protein